MRSGRMFWGLVILLIGAILLLEPLGLLPEGASVWKFIWPAVIILLGVWMLLVPAFYRGRKLETETLSIPLQGAAEAKMRLKHGAGKLEVSALEDENTLIAGEFDGGVDQSMQMDGGAVRLKLRTPSQMYPFPLTVNFAGLNWKVQVNRTIPIRLDVDSGASETLMDLSDLKVTELNLDTGASSTKITLPSKAGHTRVRIESGAASVSLLVPETVAARIYVESGLAGINIDSHRFPRMGKYYESPDYEQAQNKADIRVHTGVGSLDIR